MNHKTYKEALDRLGLPIQSARTERLLGVSGRQSAYYAAGYCPVSRRVAAILRLTAALVAAGLTVEQVVDVIRGKIFEIPHQEAKAVSTPTRHKEENFSNPANPQEAAPGASSPWGS